MSKLLYAVEITIIGSILLLSACTIHSDDINKRDAITLFVAPALCQRQSECEPAFALAYPGGVQECAAKLTAAVLREEDGNALSGCTNAQAQKCADDTRAAECPADPARAGVPIQPSSCDGC